MTNSSMESVFLTFLFNGLVLFCEKLFVYNNITYCGTVTEIINGYIYYFYCSFYYCCVSLVNFSLHYLVISCILCSVSLNLRDEIKVFAQEPLVAVLMRWEILAAAEKKHLNLLKLA